MIKTLFNISLTLCNGANAILFFISWHASGANCHNTHDSVILNTCHKKVFTHS